MSQFPSPYQPPPPPYQPPAPPGWGYGPPVPYGPDPRAPARRASVVMFILGALLLTCGGFALLATNLPTDQLQPDQKRMLDDLARSAGVSVHRLFQIVGFVLTIPGVLYLTLGFWVRSGSIVPAVLAIVLAGAHVLFQLFGLAAGVTSGPFNPLQLVLPVLVLTALGFILSNLVKACRNAPLVRQMKQGNVPPGYRM